MGQVSLVKASPGQLPAAHCPAAPHQQWVSLGPSPPAQETPSLQALAWSDGRTMTVSLGISRPAQAVPLLTGPLPPSRPRGSRGSLCPVRFVSGSLAHVLPPGPHPAPEPLLPLLLL